MKKGIHPQWYPDATVTCACGESYTIGMSKPDLSVEICSSCHPFYTGEMKYVDTLGRVERFQKKQKMAEKQSTVIAERKKKKREKEIEQRQPKSLKDMLMSMK
jgi:large subunit ribosomal protein L31